MSIKVLKMARELNQPFRPLEVADLDGKYHAFIVRYSGDYVEHDHSADELIYILEGTLEMEIAGSPVPLKQGEAVKIPAGVKHRPRCKNNALALVVETKDLQMEE